MHAGVPHRWGNLWIESIESSVQNGFSNPERLKTHTRLVATFLKSHFLVPRLSVPALFDGDPG